MENLGLDTNLIIAQLINFGVFFFIFSKFIAKPFMAYIKSEKKKDIDRTNLTEQTEKMQEELEHKNKESKETIKREFNIALDNAKKEVEAVRKELIERAQKESAEIVENTHRQMRDEKLLVDRQMKDKLVSLSTLLVEHGLKDYLDDQMKKNINDRILSNLSKQKLN
jgi:F-type H+-transporting ATPase subunit b